jgi:MerR family transcriptional regulator, redox-sensitive transcriptional activator SoxR
MDFRAHLTTSSKVEVKLASRYTFTMQTVAVAPPATQLTVGEVARRAGVPVSTVHFYQAKGLIHGWRSTGNQRRFHRGVLRRIAFIKVAQRAGISLRDIHAVLSTLAKGRAPTRRDWQRLSSQWRAELDTRILRLTQLRDRFDRCIGCGCLSLTICPLRNPGDHLGLEGPGPRLLEMRNRTGPRGP